jgi:hypothetical protein
MIGLGDRIGASCGQSHARRIKRLIGFARYQTPAVALAILAVLWISLPGAYAAGDGSSQPTWSLASVQGRWSSGDCRAKYYDYGINGNEAHFRDQTGALDIERITDVRKNGFSAVTVSSSSSSSIGTRWNYTFNGNQVRIEDVSTRRQFVQTRCSPISQQVAAVGSVSDDMQEKIPGGFVKTITRQSAGQTTLDKQLSANGVMLELTGPPLQHYRLTVNGAKLEQMDGFPRFQGVYGSYVLLEEGTGGTACPSLYRVIDLSGTIPTLTSQFGSCSDLPIVTLTANGLRVVTPAMSGPISQTVLISGGRVTKCRTTDINTCEPSAGSLAAASRLPIDESTVLQRTTLAAPSTAPPLVAGPATRLGTIGYGSRAGMEVSIVSAAGIDTEHVVVRTKHTRENAISFCRDYVQNVTEKCISQELAVPLKVEITANCKTGDFSDFHGESFRFLSANHDPRTNDMAELAIMHVATGEIADGSSASGYPVNRDIFRVLCPTRFDGATEDAKNDPEKRAPMAAAGKTLQDRRLVEIRAGKASGLAILRTAATNGGLCTNLAWEPLFAHDSDHAFILQNHPEIKPPFTPTSIALMSLNMMSVLLSEGEECNYVMLSSSDLVNILRVMDQRDSTYSLLYWFDKAGAEKVDLNREAGLTTVRPATKEEKEQYLSESYQYRHAVISEYLKIIAIYRSYLAEAGRTMPVDFSDDCNKAVAEVRLTKEYPGQGLLGNASVARANAAVLWSAAYSCQHLASIACHNPDNPDPSCGGASVRNAIDKPLPPWDGN